MVDLGGYVIILVETKEKKIKLYGSPADKADLDVGDEILEVNGKCLEDATHTEVISHIHQCIRSRTICLRVKRRTGNRLTLDVAQNSNVQDAFVIAVEQQARERLERLSALKRVKAVDMTKLSQQVSSLNPIDEPPTLNQQTPATENQQELNSFIETSPIYVTSIPPEYASGNNSRRPSSRASKASASLSNGHAVNNTSSTEEADYSAEIELKQDLNIIQDPSRQSDALTVHVDKIDSVLANRRLAASECTIKSGGVGTSSVLTKSRDGESASINQFGESAAASVTSVASASRKAYVNGRTEVLIGQDAVDPVRTTTAIVENNNNRTLGVAADLRPRRRSGSSIVVIDEDPVKHRTPEEQDEEDDIMMMMTLDNGPHREMAVDVPDSFIARSKTPPRYPPPRPVSRIPQGANGTAKPVPPPRDHLRIEKDGRLVNRAPAPQVPARPSPSLTNNNQDPTKEQLDSIRKFQEALRKRKEDEDRVAQQNEFLNRSLRGSRKLQALESHPPPAPRTGNVNDGYSSNEETTVDDDTLSTLISYGELVACLQRLQHQLKKSYSSLEGQVLAVQTLLLSPEFGRALAVHNKVQEVLGLPRHSPTTTSGQALMRDCIEELSPCSLAEAAELTDLLTRYEIEGLVYAHDAIATQHVALHVAETPPEETLSEQFLAEDNIKIIKIEKTNEPLGATVRNEGDAVVIGRIVRGGAAEKSGLLHEGDEVLEVNGIEMRGKSVNDVCDLLGAMTGTLTFIIVPQVGQAPQPHTTVRDNLMHMKAHFDYDPEEDLYIPCRELGISFQKGDVLHVISQDDANWWQAFREGEEDQTLAGLIPSRSFQHQRESLKQNISGDKGAREKMNKKTNTLLCAKKNTKKKKKSKLGVNAVYSDGSYPIYATAIETEYEVEEILTYEEVSLYYPRANHKRPIVLIGPPNIGRHELRQRLMEDAERFAAAIPHTSRSRKDGEVDGQDYHFISRIQFEADILSRRFVEHGEYEKAYYGTSLEAIRSVVSSGKICVLNLHPQSLRILRSSDLKPYVVFVAPPSLEKLRQKKIMSGEAYKEDELKDIIEKAREMEDKYGHFFDMIIINNETERAYHQLLSEINSLEREPQWVPAAWLKAT